MTFGEFVPCTAWTLSSLEELWWLYGLSRSDMLVSTMSHPPAIIEATNIKVLYEESVFCMDGVYLGNALKELQLVEYVT